MPILTDIHEPAQAAPVAEVADVLQIPGVPLPPDRPARRRGADRPRRQHQEGPVPRARRHAPRGRRRSPPPATTSVIVTERGTSASATTTWSSTCGRFPIMRGARVSRSSSTSPTACSCRAPATASPPARRSSSSRWRRRASPPASTASSWKSTSGPSRRRATRRTRCGSTCLEPLLDRLIRIHAIAHEPPAVAEPGMTSRHGHRDARPRPQGARTEAAAILAWSTGSTTTSSARVDLLFDCRGRVIVTGMGKSGIICRKIAATLSSTGTPAFFLHPAEAIHGDLGAHPRRRRGAGAVAQRRDRGAASGCSSRSAASARG